MRHFLFFAIMLAFFQVSFSQIRWELAGNKAGSSKDNYSVKLNAVYTDDLVLYNYERLIPFSEKTALGLKGGIMVQNPVMLLAEPGFVYGGPKNFMETGIGILFSTGAELKQSFFDQGILSDLENGAYFTLRAGYRYQAPGGFLLKLGALGSPGNFIIPLVGLGYVF